jgi:hypothetical protein
MRVSVDAPFMPYGDEVALDAGSGRCGIRPDRTAGEKCLVFPIADGRCGKGCCAEGGAGRQIGNGDTGTETAREAAGTMMFVRPGCSLVVAMLVVARDCNGYGKTRCAAADQCGSTDHYQEEFGEPPHRKNLPSVSRVEQPQTIILKSI